MIIIEFSRNECQYKYQNCSTVEYSSLEAFFACKAGFTNPAEPEIESIRGSIIPGVVKTTGYNFIFIFF